MVKQLGGGAPERSEMLEGMADITKLHEDGSAL